ncbi:40S ribosomal protein S17 [Vandammella animalimorsus]|uniref:40S ribosomal protein S17 n=1 Tax=Vandammella animalimorsus TaxID=2029117 RepID=UPI001177357D|nr:40S ribosomal protein S17 [Vandammella animalimorsus]
MPAAQKTCSNCRSLNEKSATARAKCHTAHAGCTHQEGFSERLKKKICQHAGITAHNLMNHMARKPVHGLSRKAECVILIYMDLSTDHGNAI